MKGAALVPIVVVIAGLGTGASAQIDEPPTVGVEVLVIEYQPEEDLTLPLVIDQLAPQTILTITASGFDTDTTGTIEQCVEGRDLRCGNRLPVRFDDRGRATFQYLVTDGIDSCRLSDDRCTIELAAGNKTSVVDTFFVDAAPALGQLDVTPRHDLVVGDLVTVTVSEFPPGSELTVLICAAPSTSGPRCGAPGPEVPLIIGPDGVAEAKVALDVSEVGSAGIACGRNVTCRAIVVSDQRALRARAVELAFTSSTGAEYSADRVIIGLAAAFALVLMGGWLIGSTNWSAPSESASTLIDEAGYADLDLEAAEFDKLSSAAPH